MGQILANTVRWVAQHLIAFAVILLILIGGNWILSQFHLAESTQAHLASVQKMRPAVALALGEAAKGIDQTVGQTTKNGYSKRAVDELKVILFKKIAERDKIKSRSLLDGLPTIDDFQQFAILEMEIAFLTQAIESIQQVVELSGDLAYGREKWIRLSAEHQQLRVRFNELEQAKRRLRNVNPLLILVPFSNVSQEINLLDGQQKSVREQADLLRNRIELLQISVELTESHVKQSEKNFIVSDVLAVATLKKLDDSVSDAFQRHSSSFFGTATRDIGDALNNQIPKAALVLLGVILVPVGIKLVFYYVIAPWASRGPPMQVVEAFESEAAATEMHGSEVSIPLALNPAEELLIHSDHIQSSSIASTKATKWILDAKFPLTSIAAGLYVMTRISPKGFETVVASSGRDPEMKISAIDLIESGYLVLQPRCLVGIVHSRVRPVKITSHWRLFHLQSWLTLQFRYLVFHGPAKLIVKGARGVKLEVAGDGRLINQAATLGFSASAMYSVRRCETFISYLRGSEQLFNDQFSGANCVYLYEEMPSQLRQNSIAGRWLEGVSDAVLKVFGI